MWRCAVLALVAVMCALGPRQPCSAEHAAMIVRGCGYDSARHVLCTSHGCFANPEIESAGPTVSTLTGNEYPAYVLLSHKVGWVGRPFVNLTAGREIVCAVTHLRR